MVPTTRFASTSIRRRLNAIAAGWQRLIKIAGNRYRPELHYMRGPGPKWHAKRQAGGAGQSSLRPAPGR
jgi:hypothetical protein